MDRYFFSLFDHVREVDDVGVELRDISAARHEAIRFAGEVLRDESVELSEDRPMQVRVTDQDGRECFRIEVRTINGQD